MAVEPGGGIYTCTWPVSPPAMRISVLETNPMISWTAVAAGFVLQRTPDVRGGWLGVTNPPAVTNGIKQVLLPNSIRTSQFYRLLLQ